MQRSSQNGITFIGGWALPPAILAPVFEGLPATGVDVNRLLSGVTAGGTLSPGWREAVAHKLTMQCGSQSGRILVGWSTGAIVAAGIASLLAPRALLLMSATPSFCIRPGHRCGQRVTVLQHMRERFAADQAGVMDAFARQCGVPDEERARFAAASASYDHGMLDNGLAFLAEVDLRPSIKPLACRSLVLHGRDDRIVPPQAGQAIAGLLQAPFEQVPGAHVFFLAPESRRRISEWLAAAAGEPA